MQENATYLSIKNWATDDKPREKLVLKGKTALSDAELIAILIGSGSRNESAVELAKRILASVNNNLNELGRLSVKQLMKFKGIGEAKAVGITAALELGRRRSSETALKVPKINSSHDAFKILHPLLGDLEHEEFWIMYLNNANKVLETSQLSVGGLTGVLVDVRIVLKRALELGAVGLILAHNHPSGTLIASIADREVTTKVSKGSKALDIKVLDHLIITQQDYFSFADNSLL